MGWGFRVCGCRMFYRLRVLRRGFEVFALRVFAGFKLWRVGVWWVLRVSGLGLGFGVYGLWFAG